MNYVVTAIICIHCVQITNERNTLVIGLWEETTTPTETPGNGEHSNATQTRSSCCVATRLTTILHSYLH